MDGTIGFRIELAPHGTWHTCINLILEIDGTPMPPLYACRSFGGIHNERDQERVRFLDEATAFTTPESETLAPIVLGALQQAACDLAALRLYDLDHGERA